MDGFEELPLTAGSIAPIARLDPGLAWNPQTAEGLVAGGRPLVPRSAAELPPEPYRFTLSAEGGTPAIAWTRVDTSGCAASPIPPATAHGLAFHEGLGAIVRFGGWTGDQVASVRTIDSVWVWDGACFGALPAFDFGQPGTPVGRYEFEFASRPGREGEVLVLGGLATGECGGRLPRDELWRWGAAAWRAETFSIEVAGGGGSEGFKSLHGATATWDPLRGLVVFGGVNPCDPAKGSLGRYANTLIVALDGRAAARWIPAGPDIESADEPRERYAMAFASGPGVVVRTGGKVDADGYAVGTFWLDDQDRWQAMSQLRSPSEPSTGARMVDVPGFGLLLFGGYEPQHEPPEERTSNRARLFSNRALRKRLGLSREP